ncbi:MAG: hypothetical protein M5U26_06100 [Planctomycetota bacterium]|nr:hypothetical protein [Planctomycetota bacterium]
MERSQWLTMLYREANLFLERARAQRPDVQVADLDELEPELHEQVQEILRATDELEDLLKFSVLRDPPPDAWRSAETWQQALIGAATACVVYDVLGIAKKILAGDLPAMPSSSIHDEVER